LNKIVKRGVIHALNSAVIWNEKRDTDYYIFFHSFSLLFSYFTGSIEKFLVKNNECGNYPAVMLKPIP